MELLSSQDLVAQVRSHADMQDSDFITDGEITNYLNLAYRTLYDIIIDTNNDLFLDNIIFRGQNYPMQLPQSFYKLRGLDVRYNNYFISAKRVGFMSRQHAQIDFVRPYDVNGVVDDIQYSLRANELKIFGTRTEQGDPFILWYLPKPKTIAEGALLPAGWERYLIYSACRDARVKEDSSTRDFEMQMRRARQDVEDYCMRRDFANNPMIQQSGDLEIEERYYGWSLGDVFAANSGNVIRTLAPSLGRQTILPPSLGVYNVIAEHTEYISDQVAYCGLQMPRGLIGKYGQWVLVFMYRDVGNVYITQNTNNSFATLDDVLAALPTSLVVDANVYKDSRPFFNSDKLCYDNNVSYSASREVGDPPSTAGCAALIYDVAVYWSDDMEPDADAAFVSDDATRSQHTLPSVDDDSYLIIQLRGDNSNVTGIFLGSALNQIDAFVRTDTVVDGVTLSTFVSKNRLRAIRFSGRQIVIEVV